MTKPPRMIDVFALDEAKTSTKDTRPLVMGEPIALDMSTVRRSRRHKTTVAQDSKPLLRSCYGEPIPIDRSAIKHSTRSAPGSLAEDAKPESWVYGEAHPIAD